MIVIVDSGLGNVGSILSMFRKIGAEALISGEVEVIGSATKLVLPGVGAFDTGMRQLTNRGLVNVLTERVLKAGTPILGICLGMQLFSRGSEEGLLSGLGWLDAVTEKFRFRGDGPVLRVPHMGWNEVVADRESALFRDLPDAARFYFVHSYHMVCREAQQVAARASYGCEFTAAISAGNIYGVQFHPEKSHKFGMRVLANFAELV